MPKMKRNGKNKKNYNLKEFVKEPEKETKCYKLHFRHFNYYLFLRMIVGLT